MKCAQVQIEEVENWIDHHLCSILLMLKSVNEWSGDSDFDDVPARLIRKQSSCPAALQKRKSKIKMEKNDLRSLKIKV